MPLLASRGGGSARGFGRFGKNLLFSFVDSLSRTTSGILGLSSDAKASWRSVVGTWQTNGSAAASLSAAANNNIAVVDLDGTTISNLQVDTGTSGGVGLSFWVTSANSYYALYPSYSTGTTTTSVCNSAYAAFDAYGPQCCGNFASTTLYRHNIQCAGGLVLNYYEASPQYGAAYYNQTCYPETGSMISAPTARGYYTCNTPSSSTVTSYTSTANLIKVESGSSTSLILNDYVSNNSGYSKAQSIAISTSGNTISYSFYSSANKGGSTIASGSSTPSSPIKGSGVGLFHASSSAEQGSTLSNFSATTTA